MTEYVANQIEASVVAELKCVRNTGYTRSDTFLALNEPLVAAVVAVLEENDLIVFSSPRPGFKYNHWKLTEAGEKYLAERGTS